MSVKKWEVRSCLGLKLQLKTYCLIKQTDICVKLFHRLLERQNETRRKVENGCKGLGATGRDL